MVYGKYVAKEPIDFGGVRAFQPGDAVPEDSVKEHGWEDLVEEIQVLEGTSDADSAIPPNPGEPSGTGQSTPPADPGSQPGKATGPAAGKKASGSRGSSSGS